MARRITKHPRLVDRDYEILDHLRRYRMTTREVLHRLFFSDSELNAVTKVTSRLVDHGFLNRYELYSGRSYFVVGPEAIKLFGLSPKKCRAIGTQALPREYGILLYCCMANTPRERLLVSELQQKVPNFTGKRSDCGHYYLDHDGETVRLAHIRVDQGGPPDHVIRKCREDLEMQLRIAAVRTLIEQDRYLVAIITATEEKAAAIREAIERHSWNVRFRVEAVEDLAQLLASGSSSRSPFEGDD
jgi:hypothetical protein